MSIYHIHHKIPKHMGGSNAPENLVKLTIEQHAEEHRILYEKYNNEFDRIAWFALLCIIPKQEIIRLAQIEGGKNSSKKRPRQQSINGGNALWNKPGMRENLSQKRKEQSASGNNPMQGKKQKRVCCIHCKQEISVNGIILHNKKCKNKI